MHLEEKQMDFIAGLVADKIARMRVQLHEVEALYAAMTDETGKANAGALQRAPTISKPKAARKTLKAEPGEKSKYRAVYRSKEGRWQAIVANKYFGAFDTQEEAATVAAKQKGVTVEELLKGAASGAPTKTGNMKTGQTQGSAPTETKAKSAGLKVSKLDLHEANIDAKDAQWLNEE